MNMNLSDDLNYAIELARGAGEIVRGHYGKVSRLTKRNDEAVTDADRQSQRFIVAGLRKKFPGDGIVGEESDTGAAITFDVSNPSGRNWVIDPIDGTNNFVTGLGAFAVCIGLLDGGNPVLGVVYDVTRNWMYSAAQGSGAWLDKQRISVLKTPLNPSSILMLTSNLVNAQGIIPPFVNRWLGHSPWKVRILGTAALEAVNVASGVAHCAITMQGKIWDAVAPCAIVLEAGGLISSLHGEPVFPFDLRNYSGGKVPFLAAAPAAQAELLKEIAL